MTTKHYQNDRRTWRHSVSLAFLAVTLCCLQACGGGGGGTNNTASSAPVPAPPPPPAQGTIVGPQGGTVTAADGGVSLAIPAGALLEDTDIVIEPIAAADLPPGFAGAVLAYDFRPDGLQFQVPARLSFRQALNLSSDGTVVFPLPSLINSSGGVLESLGDIRTDIDGEMAVATTRADITHFSMVFVNQFGLNFFAQNVTSTVVGEIFAGTYGISQSDSAFDAIVRGTVEQPQSDIKGEPSEVYDLFPGDGVQDLPFISTTIPLEVGNQSDAAVDGLCVSAGQDGYGVEFSVDYTYLIDESSGQEIVPGTVGVNFSTTVVCTAAPVPAGPEVTLVPTAASPDGAAELPAGFFGLTPPDGNVLVGFGHEDGGSVYASTGTAIAPSRFISGASQLGVAGSMSRDDSLAQQISAYTDQQQLQHPANH